MKSIIAILLTIFVTMNVYVAAYPGRWGQALALAKRTGEEASPYFAANADEDLQMERRLAFVPENSGYYVPYIRSSIKRKESSGAPTSAPRRNFNTQGWRR